MHPLLPQNNFERREMPLLSPQTASHIAIAIVKRNQQAIKLIALDINLTIVGALRSLLAATAGGIAIFLLEFSTEHFVRVTQ